MIMKKKIENKECVDWVQIHKELDEFNERAEETIKIAKVEKRIVRKEK